MGELTLISRRGFLASGSVFGGGLIVALSAPGRLLADTVLRSSGDAGEAEFRPSAYIAITGDGRVVLTIGKSEMGQGTLTGIAQLIADELECAWPQIQVVQAEVAPEFGFPANGFMITGGSTGVRSEWMRMRKMGAAARVMLLEAAAERWGLTVDVLTVRDGVVTGPGDVRATYSELAGAAVQRTVPEDPALKPKTERRFIGKPVKRLDTVQKITGRAGFGMDVEVPDMMTAVVIAPLQLGAPVKSFTADRALAHPGVTAVLPISSGIAIVGDHYWAVHSARDDIEINWGESPLAGLGMKEVRQGYHDALSGEGKLAEAKGEIDAVDGTHVVSAEFEQPFLAHACMEPMNFTVHINGDRAEAWGPTQAQSLAQKTIAQVAGIDPKNVTVHTTFLGGGFGRRSAQDFVQAAAEIAKAVGRPVKLVYSREDDMRAARLRPFNATRATGTLDEAGRLVGLDVKVATPSVSKWSKLLFLIREDGVDEQAVEGLIDLPYDIPNTRIEWVDHDPQIPVHFWRSVGASHNAFVVETLMDELAAIARQDPLDFRRAHLMDKPRHLAVLDRIAHEAGWNAPAAAGIGRGMAVVESFGSIVGQAVELRLNAGVLVIDKVTCVIDCGVAVNPGQVEAQMQSSIAYGLSAFLRGEITFDDGRIEQSNFHDYEPLRMPEMPSVTVHILEGDERPGGVGEPGLPPLLPAVANAVFALTGKPVTSLPFASQT